MAKTKYLILCVNCAHPSGELKFFLLEDEDANTVEFNSKLEAKKWCKKADSRLLAYSIICSDDLKFE